MVPNLLEKAKKTENKEELISLCRENGYDLNEADAEKYFDALHKNGEIHDDELDSVSGGACYTADGYLKTTVGYGCKYFERDPRVNKHGIDGTCYSCKYWESDMFDVYGSAAPIVLFGAPLPCYNPNNKKKK